MHFMVVTKVMHNFWNWEGGGLGMLLQNFICKAPSSKLELYLNPETNGNLLELGSLLCESVRTP